jgi:hypothetical protein
MLVEVLSILSREFDELRDYRYYGLGGPFLEDIRLIGEYFENLPLVSLESSEQTHRRQRFHKCAKNVTLKKETVQAFLNTASWAKPAAYWLDYTDLIPARIQEFQSLIDRVRENSVVKITLRAALDDLSDACIRGLAEIGPELPEQWRERQLAAFKSTFEAVVPPSIDSSRLRPGNFPMLVQDMLRIASQQTLQASGRQFQILHSCFYSDHTPMYSLTGLVCADDDTRRFQQLFARWPHKNLRWAEPQRIDMPVLSTKERMALEALLPAKKTTGKALRRELGYNIDEGMPATIRKLRHYATYYRYYPHFAKVAVV